MKGLMTVKVVSQLYVFIPPLVTVVLVLTWSGSSYWRSGGKHTYNHNRLKGTDWGDLDVLVLDLPPGTGDVPLGVLQQLQLSGAVAVSTPSRLATADTRKGIEMFTSLGVPTMAVVENMAYFEVYNLCGHGHPILAF
jgi:ATP-binding protein involved in chromosome partitioning